MRKTHIFWAISISVVLLGCSSPRLRSSFSCNDAQYFSERPFVLNQGGSYELHWLYGSWGFYFQPEAKVVEGELHFGLLATSSSGNLRGKPGSLLITNPDHISAIKKHGAFWVEPDGSKIHLEIKTL